MNEPAAPLPEPNPFADLGQPLPEPSEEQKQSAFAGLGDAASVAGDVAVDGAIEVAGAVIDGTVEAASAAVETAGAAVGCLGEGCAGISILLLVLFLAASAALASVP